MPMHVQLSDVQAWLDSTKAQIPALDPVLELNISGYVLGRLMDTFNNNTFGVSTWLDFNSTPLLVRQAIALLYAAWFYDKQYSEVASDTNKSPGTPYGTLLRDTAEQLIEGLIRGSILLAEIQPNSPAVAPVFYPNDAISTLDAQESNIDPDDFSQGPVMFGVAKVFLQEVKCHQALRMTRLRIRLMSSLPIS